VTAPREVALLPLGDTGWSLWSECELRSAGLPAALAGMLFDELLEQEASRAGTRDAESFRAAYARAEGRVTEAIARACANGLFTEMIAWQNPEFARTCVAGITAGRAARPAVRRRRELKIASYLQRYTLRNETIGFFGPVCWARWTGSPRALELRSGASLTAARRTYFEYWAVEAVAAALAEDVAVRPWLKPRASSADVLIGTCVHRPYGEPVPLTRAEAEAYQLCDGSRTLRELARLSGTGADGADGAAAGMPGELARLIEAGLVCVGFDVPVGVRSERWLRREVCSIGDPAARRRALAVLDELSAARDEVSRAAGDTGELLGALDLLEKTFERVTGRPASRRSGEAYAGRRIIYEETRRDVDVRLGHPLIDAMAAPLGLVLDSARWFTGHLAEAYLKRFEEIYERRRASSGDADVTLASLLSAATPDLAFSFRELAPLVAAAVPELQRRWAQALRLPPGARRHVVRSGEIADAIRRLFPRSAPRWSSAVHHCPDVMVAAPSAAAVDRGDFLLVLGELHLASNTLDWSALDLHPNPAAVWAADLRDRGGARVLPVPAKASDEVNTRIYPPTILSPDYTYWTMHAGNTGAPGPILPGAGLTVHREDHRLVVRTPHGAAIDLLEMLGEYVSAAIMNAFAPIASAVPEPAPAPGSALTGYRPRVVIDRMVIARSSWSFAPSRVAWAFVKDPADRYRAAQSWRRAHELPRRAFYRVVVETKPLFIDFTSITLVNLLAAAIRRAAEEDESAPVSLTEMLPDLGGQWLRGADGAAYTSELRLVLTDGGRAG
jgi:hypothetical protein